MRHLDCNEAKRNEMARPRVANARSVSLRVYLHLREPIQNRRKYGLSVTCHPERSEAELKDLIRQWFKIVKNSSKSFKIDFVIPTGISEELRWRRSRRAEWSGGIFYQLDEITHPNPALVPRDVNDPLSAPLKTGFLRQRERRHKTPIKDSAFTGALLTRGTTRRPCHCGRNDKTYDYLMQRPPQDTIKDLSTSCISSSFTALPCFAV